MDNYEIADAFSLLSKLMDIHGENSFKSKNYSIAAFNIEKLPNQLAAMDTAEISSLKGIGDSTAKKIHEMLSTGSMKALADIIMLTPPGILEMMQIKGIGPKKINTIWKEMEIESVGELLYACNENRLTLYKGFGAKTQDNIKETIEYYLSQQGYFLYQQAEALAEKIIAVMQEAFPTNKIFITGDYRRQAEIIEKLEFVSDIDKLQVQNFLEQQTGFHFISDEEEALTFRLESGPGIKWYYTTKQKLVQTLFLTTGGKEFSENFKENFADILAGSGSLNNEKKIFERAGIQYVDPCLRDSEGIIEKAGTQSIDKLIQPDDIKGIIHCHSTWSDGTHTIAAMAKAARDIGLEYLVISDHSRSAGYANGLTVDRLKLQHDEIDMLNKELTPFKIFKSIESDILVDGNLDYPAEVLATFDLVIASVHSVLKMTEEKAMARLIKAIENPYTTILGHMTGRLLLSRSGYPINHKKIIEACAANKVVIELNAHPRRLDMDWRWIPYAIEKGVLISIDPDAHAIEGFRDTKYGVLTAQKGMLTAAHNLSSFGLKEFEDYLQSKPRP
jgi:DNA polymerase (family 10)